MIWEKDIIRDAYMQVRECDFMKIGFISDIHLDLISNFEEFMDIFYKEIKSSQTEILVIAGDISENAFTTIDYVNTMKELMDIPVYYVPGNHDMWYKTNRLTTQKIYKMYKEDDNCLTGKVVELNDKWVLMGDVFWYDYSYANNNKFSRGYLQGKEHDSRVWQDYFYVNWLKDDESKCREFVNNAEKTIKSLSDKNIILISHMINHKAFTVPEERKEMWGFFNGFLGSESLYELIKRHNIKIAVCGHVHHRHMFTEDDTSFVCSCLGYENEWPMFDENNLTPGYQIRNALTILEI